MHYELQEFFMSISAPWRRYFGVVRVCLMSPFDHGPMELVEGRPAAEVSGQVGFYGSVLPAAWSLMLALRARGLGTTWTSLHTLFAPEAAELLGIPDDVTQTVLLPVGYMKNAVLRPAERRPPHEVTYWNTWGTRRTEST